MIGISTPDTRVVWFFDVQQVGGKRISDWRFYL